MSPDAITVGAVDSADTPAFGVNPAQSESFSSSGAGHGTPVCRQRHRARDAGKSEPGDPFRRRRHQHDPERRPRRFLRHVGGDTVSGRGRCADVAGGPEIDARAGQGNADRIGDLVRQFIGQRRGPGQRRRGSRRLRCKPRLRSDRLAIAAATPDLTDRGEIPVEELRIGDRLADDSAMEADQVDRAAQLYRAVCAGSKRHSADLHQGRRDGADQTPRRDLWISPHHAMFLDGVPIEAKDLHQ